MPFFFTAQKNHKPSSAKPCGRGWHARRPVAHQAKSAIVLDKANRSDFCYRVLNQARKTAWLKSRLSASGGVGPCLGDSIVVFCSAKDCPFAGAKGDYGLAFARVTRETRHRTMPEKTPFPPFFLQ